MSIRLLILSIAILGQYNLFATAPIILHSSSKTKMHFYYHDSLGYGHPVNVSFGQTKVYINSPVLLFEADKNQTPYLVYPGEKITIKKEGSESATLTVGSDNKRTNELLFFRLLVKQTGGIYMTFPFHDYQGKARDLGQFYQFEKEINSMRNYREAFLDSFSRKLPVSDVFKKIVAKVFFSTAIKDSLLLLWNNKKLLQAENLYDNAFKKIIRTINGNPYSPLMTYLYAVLLPACINNNTLEFFINSQQLFEQTFNFIDARFTGMAKDFLLARVIVAALANNVLVPNEYLQKFYNVCTDSTYTSLVNNKLAEVTIERNSKGRNALLDLDKHKSELEVIINKHAGKLIYIDFWASWCTPCRAEMPASRTIKRLFVNKSIVFVYVSIDTGIADWIRATLEENLGAGESYLLLNSNASPFVRQYKIQSIPRYLLIGKNGKVLSANAPRPGDSALIKLIEKYL